MNRLPFTNALASALEAGLAGLGEGGTDILVGRDRPPARGNLNYVILYSLPGGDWIGPPVNPGADAAFLYQVKCVAKRSTSQNDQLGAEAMGDLVRPIMLAAGTNVPGITRMRAYSNGVGGNDADDRVMNFDERFIYLVTSS